jgi:hypothetical protein
VTPSAAPKVKPSVGTTREIIVVVSIAESATPRAKASGDAANRSTYAAVLVSVAVSPAPSVNVSAKLPSPQSRVLGRVHDNRRVVVIFGIRRLARPGAPQAAERQDLGIHVRKVLEQIRVR